MMSMAKQITIRGVTPELSRRLEQLAKARGSSLNATVLGILERASGTLFAGDAAGVRLPEAGFLRPATPPADFDLEQAVSSLHRFAERQPRAVVGDVVDATRPDEPVTGLVAAARCVSDRGDDGRRDPVLHDERQHCLGQEARLEDASAIFVSDTALPPVPDRLDDRHADVTGLLLDRVDHRLDPLADDDGLDLDHTEPILWL